MTRLDYPVTSGHRNTQTVLVQLDPSVVKRAQRGDERAFSVIVSTYQGPVFNYVLRSVGDRELAEDLTQDVFLRAWKSLSGYGYRAQLTTWLFQVAKNVVLDSVRAQSSRPRSVELVPELTPAIADAPIEQSETIDALWAAIGELSFDLKTPLLLRDVVGLSYNEIADALSIPLSTVKWRIYSAREAVQVLLAQAGITAGAAANG
jgi:RNA polymerase sigma-70 factor (ECF subfamily)